MENTDIKVETWYEPATDSYLVHTVYRINRSHLRFTAKTFDLKDMFMRTFVQMTQVVVQFVRGLVYDKKGFQNSYQG